MSELHIFNTFKISSEDRKFNFVLGKKDSSTPKELLLESTEVMIKVTEVILGALHDWYKTKESPEKMINDRKDWLKQKGLTK